MSAFLYLYVAFFSIGWQGMGWLWAVELVPLSIRGPANALVSFRYSFIFMLVGYVNNLHSRLP
jgi:hypothetical protein